MVLYVYVCLGSTIDSVLIASYCLLNAIKCENMKNMNSYSFASADAAVVAAAKELQAAEERVQAAKEQV